MKKIKQLAALVGLFVCMGLPAWGQGQFSGGGGTGAKINGSPVGGNCASWLNSTTLQDAGGACGGAPAFGAVTTGTNTTNLFMGTGGVLSFSGTGIVNANQLNGTALSGLATGPLFNTTGTGVPFVGTLTGNTTLLPTFTGPATASRCIDTDASGNLHITAADCGAGGGLPSGTQGEALVNTTGASTYATSPLWFDASQYSGSDSCAQIAAAATGQHSLNFNQLATHWPTIGQQNCAASPFASGWRTGGELSFDGQVDIRTGVPWIIPGGVHMHGTGESGTVTSSNGTADNKQNGNYYNVIIRACNPKIFNCPTEFAVPHEAIPNAAVACSGGNTQSSICVSGTTAFVNVTNTLNVGQEVVITNTANNTLGVTGQFYSGFVLAASGSQFQITVPSGTPTCTSTCGTVYEATPLISNAFQTFRTEIDHISLDCAFVVGCIPFVNDSGQEQSLYHDINTTGSGVDELGRFSTNSTAYQGVSGGSIHSGPHQNYSATVGVETCEKTAGPSNCFTALNSGNGTGFPVSPNNGVYPAGSLNSAGLNPFGCDTRGLVVDGLPTGAAGGPIFGIAGFTLNTGVGSASVPATMNNATCAGHAPVGIFIENVEVEVHNFHAEWWLQPVMINGQTAVNPDYPNVATNNVEVDNFEICCGGGSPNAVEIGPNSTQITVRNWDAVNINPLHDAVAGNTCNGGEFQESYYILGNSSNQVDTNCVGVTNVKGALKLTTGLATGSALIPGSGIVNAGTGFEIGGVAPSNHILCGNGTNYVDNTPGGCGIAGGTPTFDSTAIVQPAATASWTFPNSAWDMSLAGTAPASSSTTGTVGISLQNNTGVTGGASSGNGYSSGTGGTGLTITGGTGGAQSGGAVAGSPFTLTQVGVAGGTATYTGTITGGGANAFQNMWFQMGGFANGANNQLCQATGSTATTITCIAQAQINETHAGTATNQLQAFGGAGITASTGTLGSGNSASGSTIGAAVLGQYSGSGYSSASDIFNKHNETYINPIFKASNPFVATNSTTGFVTPLEATWNQWQGNTPASMPSVFAINCFGGALSGNAWSPSTAANAIPSCNLDISSLSNTSTSNTGHGANGEFGWGNLQTYWNTAGAQTFVMSAGISTIYANPTLALMGGGGGAGSSADDISFNLGASFATNSYLPKQELAGWSTDGATQQTLNSVVWTTDMWVEHQPINTSGGNIAQGLVVKYDTAHAGGFVEALHTDHGSVGVLEGFILTSGGTTCANATSCAIGKRGIVAGDLTSSNTCSIGNNVVISSTTDGQVQCEAVGTSTGDILGTAISSEIGGGLISVDMNCCKPGDSSSNAPASAKLLSSNSNNQIVAASASVAPIAVSATGAISVQNATPANITAAIGTDTSLPTASGTFTNGQMVQGDSNGGITGSGVAIPAGCTASECSWVVGAPGISPGQNVQTGVALGNTALNMHFMKFHNDITRKLGTTCLLGVQTVSAGNHMHAGVYSSNGTTLTLQWDCGQMLTTTAGQVSNTSVTAFTLAPGDYYLGFCADINATFIPYVLYDTTAATTGASSFAGGSNSSHDVGIDSTAGAADQCSASATALGTGPTIANIAFTRNTTVVDIPYVVSTNP